LLPIPVDIKPRTATESQAMNRNDFSLRKRQGVQYYSCRAFESVPQLSHAFSTRHGDAGALLSALRLDALQLAMLRQVHSNTVHIIDDYRKDWKAREGDALATRMENVAVAVRTADCVPVLLVDPMKRAIAAVHAGWRGTVKRILSETVFALNRAFGSDPADLLVAAGPGIGECCFETGVEVAELFEKEFPGASLAQASPVQAGKYHLDLWKALQIQLKSAGVREQNCHNLNACTCCGTGRFFSYRAEGAAAGRMMAVIALTAAE